jgi:hypothetical protein
MPGMVVVIVVIVMVMNVMVMAVGVIMPIMVVMVAHECIASLAAPGPWLVADMLMVRPERMGTHLLDKSPPCFNKPVG